MILSVTRIHAFFKLVMLLTIAGASNHASAQTVIPADLASLQPLVYRDGATINGCGLRGVIASVVDEKKADFLDFSITAMADANSMHGMAKAGAFTANPARAVEARSNLPVTSFFAASEDGQFNVAPVKTTASDTEGFILGGFDFNAAVETLFAMQNGDRFQFGAQVKGERLMRVYSFNAEISEQDRSTFFACMQGLTKAVSKGLPKDGK